MKPGIYRNLPFNDYRAIDAYNPSTVLAGRLSMLHLQYERGRERIVTPAMRLGAAIHCSVLEPDLFPLRYCIWDGGRRAGKEYAAFVEANDGREILSRDEYDLCLGARNAARSHPVAGPALSLIDQEDREVSLVWQDDNTGLLCKGRADILYPHPIVELKTSRIRIASDRAVTRLASSMGWHVALAAYQYGVSALTGETPDVLVVLVEQFPPHDVRVLTVPDTVMIQGYDEWARLLERIAECESTGTWPGCDQGTGTLTVWHDEGEWEVE